MENYINKEFACKNSPVVSQKWVKLSNIDRIKLIMQELAKEKTYENFICIKADSNGNIVLKIVETIPAHQRGVLLIDLEMKLKKNVDKGITIWLEPIGDKSKLRNLRGIIFKEI